MPSFVEMELLAAQMQISQVMPRTHVSFIKSGWPYFLSSIIRTICNYTSNDKNGWLNVLRAEELKEKLWQNWCCVGSDADIQQIWIEMLECGIFKDFTFRRLKKRHIAKPSASSWTKSCVYFVIKYMQMKFLLTLLRHLCKLRILAIKIDILWNSRCSWLIIWTSVHKPSFGVENFKN